jgi:carboxypeptidase D
MHGNEVIGREILLNLIEVLLKNYQSVDCVKKLVDSTRIHILPSMNPDGFEISQPGDFEGIQGRANFRGRDLNRNFPDQYAVTEDNRVQEPETLAVMQWIKSYPFVLSANLHGGSLVANYPFDDAKDTYRLQTPYSQSPDDAIFKQLAETYSQARLSNL